MPEEQELLDSSLNIIRARTLSILRRFKNDAERKTSVIRFLIETDLVCKSKLNLKWAKLQGATLQEANLEEANLEEANLEGANLEEANLQGANLERAKLQGAKLQDARLQFAELQGADLKWAELQGAELQFAKLEGADLRRANLQGADLNDIKWDSKTLWPDKSKFTDAKNIPEELKKELGITP
jgi:uncharacterized protein YjbI with pentapeptide repeats